MLADGDVVGARLFFERAASSFAAAALAEGKTFDPSFLDQIGARGIQPDRAAAAYRVRKSRMLGEPSAAALLERLQASPPS